MREAIGGSWIYGLVITFIVFFASFLALSINYSKAFITKNNIVDLISKYEGNNENVRLKIADHLKQVGYLVPGDCNKVFDGSSCVVGYGLDGKKVSGNQAYYCVMKGNTNGFSTISKNYYSVAVFFKIDLPVVGDLVKLNIKGDTEAIYFANDDMNC